MLDVEIGFLIGHSSHIQLSNSTIGVNSQGQGISIRHSINNSIIDSHIEGNSGAKLPHGIGISYSDDNLFKNNTISKHSIGISIIWSNNKGI